MGKYLALLAVIAFFFFGICDALSTIYVYSVVQTFQYEQSFLLKLCFDIGGLWGFVIVKMLIVILPIYGIYYLGSRYPLFAPLSEWLCIAITVVGVYVSTMNVWGAITLDTPMPLGISPYIIAIAILFSGLAIGAYKSTKLSASI